MVCLLLFLALLLCSCSCDLPQDTGHFRVLSYNVQNLFDTQLDGTEYAEYQDSKAWAQHSYRQRLKTLSQVVLHARLNLPDVLVLQEVENRSVVEDLLTYHLHRHGYQWFATAKGEGDAISVAIISRHPIKEAKVHTGAKGTRPILEATVGTEGEDVVLFALHAKSQIGEFAQTEALRLEVARTVIAAARQREGSLILLCGDFNSDPSAVWEGGDVQTALVDVNHPTSMRYLHEGSIVLTGDRTEVSSLIWYSGYLDQGLGLGEKGSCNWDGSWHQYDQILGNGHLFDRRGWEFSSFAVCDLPLCLEADGRPKAWNLQTLNGVSDHLPVLLTLSRL